MKRSHLKALLLQHCRSSLTAEHLYEEEHNGLEVKKKGKLYKMIKNKVSNMKAGSQRS